MFVLSNFYLTTFSPRRNNFLRAGDVIGVFMKDFSHFLEVNQASETNG